MLTPLSKTKLSYFRKFQQKKVREEEGLFIIEGWHLIEEALKASHPLRTLIYDPTAKRDDSENEVLKLALEACDEAYEADASQLERLSDTKASQGVLALAAKVGCSFDTLLDRLPSEGSVRLMLLDELGDPGNCGSIVRACDWFGLNGVVLGTGCAELENGKTARSTMGGLFHLPIAVGVDLDSALDRLKQLGVQIFTTELDERAVSLSDFSFPDRCALVIGNEARGVSEIVSKKADGKLFAPKFGEGESLNAAVAAAVFLARWRL
nr:RNA methyltransferase [Pelagicoccus albus]